MKKTRVWGRSAYGQTDSNQSPQQYNVYQKIANSYNLVSQVTDNGTENINTTPYYLECDCSNNSSFSNSFLFSFPQTWGGSSLSISEIRLYGSYFSLTDSSDNVVSDLSNTINSRNLSDGFITYYKKTKIQINNEDGVLIKEIDNSIVDNSSVIVKYIGANISTSTTSDTSGVTNIISDTANYNMSIIHP